MKTWASEDVARLFQVASKQDHAFRSTPSGMLRAKNNSVAYSKVLVDMNTKILICKIEIGRFIGRGGQNIRRVERNTGFVMYKISSLSHSSQFVVYYPSEASLRSVEREVSCEHAYVSW